MANQDNNITSVDRKSSDFFTRTRRVYIIEANGLSIFKVGVSSRPAHRLTSLQGGSPVRLVILGHWEATARIEMNIHKELDDYRIHGEWFFTQLRIVAEAVARHCPDLTQDVVMADIANRSSRVEVFPCKLKTKGVHRISSKSAKGYELPMIPGIRWERRADGSYDVMYLPVKKWAKWKLLGKVSAKRVREWATSDDEWLPMRWVAERRSKL